MSLWSNTDEAESAPKFINLSDTSLYPTGTRVIFVDQEEAQTADAKSKGIHGPGWYTYYEYTGSGNTNRIKCELIAAMSVDPLVSGDRPADADDDIVPPIGVITLSLDPVADSAIAPMEAVFTCDYSIDTDETVVETWQVSDDVGVTWANIIDGGAYAITTKTLTVTTAVAMNENLYRVVLTALGAPAVTSDSAELTVVAGEITITSDLVNDSAVEPVAASFTIDYTIDNGETVTETWQVSSNAGVTWTPIVNSTPYAITAKTLTIDPTAVAMNSYQYRVILSATGAANVTSSAATLTVTV